MLIIFISDNGLLLREHGMVDKHTTHEPSIRAPLGIRYPGLTLPSKPVVVRQMTLTVDFAPSILDICGLPPVPKQHGRPWRKPASGQPNPQWRKSFLYWYNYGNISAV